MDIDYKERTYRAVTNGGDFASFEIAVYETDLKIYVDKALEPEIAKLKTLCQNHVKILRAELKAYIAAHPQFAVTLTPWPLNSAQSPLVQSMVKAGNMAGVGPMAAVAGAFAQFTALELVGLTESIIIENGGDIYVNSRHETVAGVFAGQSPLSMRLGLVIPPQTVAGVCTSSGTVGHSLSLGKADAVCVAAKNAPLADALATAIGNMVKSEKDFEEAVNFARQYNEVLGVILIYGDKSAIWGELEVKPLK